MSFLYLDAWPLSHRGKPRIVVATFSHRTFRSGDRLMVTVTTTPGSPATDRFFLVVGLETPVNTTENPLFIFRFDPVVELLPLPTALARPSPAEIAARPLRAVTEESFVILDVALPPGLPVGSYTWLTVLVSEDLRELSSIASAPFSVQCFGRDGGVSERGRGAAPSREIGMRASECILGDEGRGSSFTAAEHR